MEIKLQLSQPTVPATSQMCGTFNADFLPWWRKGEEGGRGRKHSHHVASQLDKRQPIGSRPGEVDEGEDAVCVSL